MNDIKSKSLLKQISFLAYIMAAIDKDLDEEEVLIIRNFIESNWNSEYGDIEKFIRVIDQETIEIVFSDGEESLFDEKIDTYIAVLKEVLNDAQRKDFLEFIEKVIAADDFINRNELKLFDRYKLIV